MEEKYLFLYRMSRQADSVHGEAWTASIMTLDEMDQKLVANERHIKEHRVIPLPTVLQMSFMQVERAAVHLVRGRIP